MLLLSYHSFAIVVVVKNKKRMNEMNVLATFLIRLLHFAHFFYPIVRCKFVFASQVTSFQVALCSEPSGLSTPFYTRRCSEIFVETYEIA